MPTDVGFREEDSLDWRSVVRGAKLEGPLRHLAASGEVLELTRNHVKLRITVTAFATEGNRQLLSDALSKYFGEHCLVEFEVGEVKGDTLVDAEARERIAVRRRMIDGFANDPFVKAVVERFHGTIDESSVRPVK